MRFLILISLLHAVLVPLSAQSLLGFSGGQASSAGGSFSWSAGEVVVQTAQSTATAATQGFQQPLAAIVVVDTVTENPVEVNAITPNGDAVNEFFLIKNAGQWPNSRLIILNRWQEIVFRTDGYQNDWHGTTQDGAPLPTAAYYYLFWTDPNVKATPFQGTIHVLR